MGVASAAIPLGPRACNGWTPLGTRWLPKVVSTNDEGRDIARAVPERHGRGAAGVRCRADENAERCRHDDEQVLLDTVIIRRTQLIRSRTSEATNMSVVKETVDVASGQTRGSYRLIVPPSEV